MSRFKDPVWVGAFILCVGTLGTLVALMGWRDKAEREKQAPPPALFKAQGIYERVVTIGPNGVNMDDYGYQPARAKIENGVLSLEVTREKEGGE